MADPSGQIGAGAAQFGLGLPGGDRPRLPTCLVLGNFDGVHLGHQALLRAARVEADRLGLALTAVTFEPHPRTVLDPGLDFRLLSTFDLRRRLLAANGVDRVWVVPFDERLRGLSPDAFMGRLRDQLEIGSMVVGPGFSIGKGAEGRLEFLTGYAAEAGFPVRMVEEQVWRGLPVSSSAIRAQLVQGDLGAVQEMLGRPLQVLGQVVHGEGLGHQLGFPTANIRFAPNQALPGDGVYVMDLTPEGGGPLAAVGSIGSRPHFGGEQRLFEVHCLEAPGDLYGREVLAGVLRRLRPQAAFSSDQALVEQMARDAEAAAAYFASLPQ
ncbi:MAG TPA: riboflavin biosynthesis protein RibF [Candidatus Dormibacteraeota bacterium]